jgi:RHS repeat-associated protein
VPSGGITTNTWDFENRLTKVALPTGVLNTFTYNGDGMRVQRQDSNGTLKAIWDGEKILEETNQNNVVQAIYTQSAGVYGDVVSQRRSGVSRYFLFDPLGSTSRLTDGGQNVTDSYLLKGFGESLLAAGPTTNPFQYVGREGYYLDSDLAWNFVRTREFYAAIGRWTATDPVGLVAGTNLYEYASNNPCQLIDPSGRATSEVICILADQNGTLSTHPTQCDLVNTTPKQCCIDLAKALSASWYNPLGNTYTVWSFFDVAAAQLQALQQNIQGLMAQIQQNMPWATPQQQQQMLAMWLNQPPPLVPDNPPPLAAGSNWQSSLAPGQLAAAQQQMTALAILGVMWTASGPVFVQPSAAATRAIAPARPSGTPPGGQPPGPGGQPPGGGRFGGGGGAQPPRGGRFGAGGRSGGGGTTGGGGSAVPRSVGSICCLYMCTIAPNITLLFATGGIAGLKCPLLVFPTGCVNTGFLPGPCISGTYVPGF